MDIGLLYAKPANDGPQLNTPTRFSQWANQSLSAQQPGVVVPPGQFGNDVKKWSRLSSIQAIVLEGKDGWMNNKLRMTIE